MQGFAALALIPDSEVLDWLIRYGYLLMFLLMLIEGPTITASAALGAALGYFNVFVVFALSFLGNFLPDMLYYMLGPLERPMGAGPVR